MNLEQSEVPEKYYIEVPGHVGDGGVPAGLAGGPVAALESGSALYLRFKTIDNK